MPHWARLSNSGSSVWMGASFGEQKKKKNSEMVSIFIRMRANRSSRSLARPKSV
jgi:hypothetical protein